MTQPQQQSALLNSSWRLFPSLHAERAGKGEWIRYPWLSRLMEHMRPQLLEGGARFIINAPPQFGKSEAISHRIPAWYLDLFPHHRVIMGCYGSRLAAKWGRKTRDYFLNNDQAITNVSKNKNAAHDWTTLEGGGMFGVGVGKGVTGEGGNLIIIDDPHKDWAEALSPTFRQNTIDWYDSTLSTRKQPKANIILIQTRWHEDDLTGYLLREQPDVWEHIRLPALAEEDDWLGREVGESLCPERWSIEALEETKKDMPALMWAGLYQQRPAPLDGNIIMRADFNRYIEDPLTMTFDEIIQVWDPTFKETGTSMCTGHVWGRKGADFFVCDEFRARVSFVAAIKAIENMTNQWPAAKTKLIEEAANGHAIISTLKNQIPGVIPVPPKGSKTVRLISVSGLFESGHVWVPAKASWTADFIEEHVNFPNGLNDRPDCTSMALTHLSRHTAPIHFSLPTAGTRRSPWDFDSN